MGEAVCTKLQSFMNQFQKLGRLHYTLFDSYYNVYLPTATMSFYTFVASFNKVSINTL